MFCRCSLRAVGAFFLVGLMGFSVGCSGAAPRATVKGKVSIGGKALTTGNVMFWGDNDATASAAINENGEYVMTDAPVGDVKITISVPKIPPGGLERMQAMSGKAFKDIKSVDPESGKSISNIMGTMPANIVPVPEKYADKDASGLTYTVVRGEQTKDLTLTP